MQHNNATTPHLQDSSNEEKLKFYSLFKQATVGDVQGDQPWAVQVEKRAKWDAWNSRKGLSKDDAKAQYVEAVTAGQPDWLASDIVKNMPADFKVE